MKILAIGNSFSQDATRYLREIAASAGEDLFVRNLYIGGCSLQMHADNIESNAPSYVYETDAHGTEKISIPDALMREAWDYVTVQQVSGQSGKSESYEPYLSYILKTIKEACPGAEILFHRTWAYEIGSGHRDFVLYNNSQLEMYGAIVAATAEIAARHGIRIIPVGDFIQVLRGIPPFDYKNGGMTLCRDNFHLSFDYGRYAAGLCWFKFFTGRNAGDVTFVPENADASLVGVINKTVDMLYI